MRRQVTGLVKVPYDRFPDGKPKTYDAYQLECGHRIRAAVTTGANRALATSAIDLNRESANCTTCDKETT